MLRKAKKIRITFTKKELDRVVYLLMRPCPPGPEKELDLKILTKIRDRLN